MTVYWFPSLTGHEYKAVDLEVPLDELDVFCGPCGPAKPRRLAHFVRPVAQFAGPLGTAVRVAPVGIRPFRAQGQTQGPLFWTRNGVLRWRLACAHDSNISLPDVAKLMDAGVTRVSLWPDGRVTP